MTKMETMNTKFAALTEEELMDVDGGGWLIPILVGGAILGGGILWGYHMG